MLENEIDVKSLWLQICNILKSKLNDFRYAAWIEVLKPVCYFENTLMVLCPSEFIKTSVNTTFKAYIEDVINTILSDITDKKTILLVVTSTDKEYLDYMNNSGVGQVSFICNDSKENKTTTKKKKLKNKIVDDDSMSFPDRYTFDNFVTGGNSEFAVAASRAVAENPGLSYNPLFIYGNPGLGKTHLMKAIGHEINKNFDCKILYTTSENLLTDLVNLIQKKGIDPNINSKFIAKYRSVDVLLIDDIQFMVGKDRTQEEFFHIFNELYSKNKQIVISSDRPANDLKNLEERLKSRFNMGLTVDIQFPDFETRLAILQNKMKLESIELTNEILEFIAMNIKTNIRDLEGALINVLAHYKLKKNAPMTVDYVKTILCKKLNEINKKEITIDLIKETVAKYFKINISDLSSKNRSSSISYPRQVAMYLCRNMLDCALGNIGDAFEKDHTTIMHGVKQIDKKIKTSDSIKKDVDTLKKLIEG
ncbi:replication initiator protein DnaA [Tissierellia bacterium KA00581]|nr:replication initiator protein DnaA [Tissierellia bacterium KA00581]